ncbi:MAG: NTP transferase domain-containing protein [Candidatus Omnitrophica bacterium]|nr:NTP transferase domain-containing protein [Candidatus Omnitrophota bacterium]
MKNIIAIILAAGEGTRMKSNTPKVLHKVCGKPMLGYMLDLLPQLGIDKSIVVLGHKLDKVKQFLGANKAKTLRQPKLLGSGDAVWQTRKSLGSFRGTVLVIYGDTPLVTYQSLKDLIRTQISKQPSCTILTAKANQPTGFGRILRDDKNQVSKIVEEQDADEYQKAILEINVGAYCFKAQELFSALKEIKPNNAKKEYYLTDAVEVLAKQRRKIATVFTQDKEEALGVNSRSDLARAHRIINKRRVAELLAAGVTIIDPNTTYLYGDIEVGTDTIIYPHTVIEGKVKIGRSCKIGPFAHLRSGTVLKDKAQIGNFVEIVRSTIGASSKVKHHSYVGDTIVGQRVNVGAGVITANYDGKNKNRTTIGDRVFLGVGAILIAPVKIGKRAVVGAGSVVTKNKDVPVGATVAGVPAKVLKKKKKKG